MDCYRSPVAPAPCPFARGTPTRGTGDETVTVHFTGVSATHRLAPVQGRYARFGNRPDRDGSEILPEEPPPAETIGVPVAVRFVDARTPPGPDAAS